MPDTGLSAASRALRPTALIVLLAVLAACEPSSSPSASVAPPTTAACSAEEVRGGGISGRVVDTEGNPLSDILILVQAPGGFTGTTRTGQEGVFSAADVSGEFQITTTDIAYREVVRRVTVPCGELVEVELVLTPVDG